MIVCIDGWWGSGKSVMRGLLDGHPQLFVSPIQDSLISAFARDWERRPWMAHRDIEQLRKLLASLSQYPRIERFALHRTMHLDISSKERAYIEIDIDFPAFDRDWVERVVDAEQWSAELICTEIFAAMMRHWRRYPLPTGSVIGYATAENNRRPTAGYFLEHFPHGKLIYCIRAAEGIIGTRAHRTPVKEDFRTAGFEAMNADQLIRAGEARQIVERAAMARRLADQHPDRMLIVDFEPMIERTPAVMDRVARFLGIERLPVLDVFSHMGAQVVGPNGSKYVGKIHDRAEDLLTERQRQLIAADIDRRRLCSGELLSRPGVWCDAATMLAARAFKALRQTVGDRIAGRRGTWQPGAGAPPK